MSGFASVVGIASSAARRRTGTRLPFAARQLRLRARSWRDIDSSVAAAVQTFAVDGHRRRDDDLLELVACGEDLLKEDRRAEGVDRRVALDLVHRLADPDRRREVYDSIDAHERSTNRIAVAHIRLDELRLRIQVRPDDAVVDLRVERVEYAYLVPLLEQEVDDVRADEPRAASDRAPSPLGTLASSLVRTRDLSPGLGRPAG